VLGIERREARVRSSVEAVEGRGQNVCKVHTFEVRGRSINRVDQQTDFGSHYLCDPSTASFLRYLAGRIRLWPVQYMAASFGAYNLQRTNRVIQYGAALKSFSPLPIYITSVKQVSRSSPFKFLALPCRAGHLGQ
jgi:hypothetical protein